jgi:hypothetical protein
MVATSAISCSGGEADAVPLEHAELGVVAAAAVLVAAKDVRDLPDRAAAGGEQTLHRVFGRGLQVAVAGDLDALQVRIGDRRRAELRRVDLEQSLCPAKWQRMRATISARRRRLASGALACQAGGRRIRIPRALRRRAPSGRRSGGRKGPKGSRAGRVAGKRSGLDARDVLARARIALDDLALIDEQRHLDRGAGGQAGRLAATGGGVAADSGLGVGRSRVRRSWAA